MVNILLCACRYGLKEKSAEPQNLRSHARKIECGTQSPLFLTERKGEDWGRGRCRETRLKRLSALNHVPRCLE